MDQAIWLLRSAYAAVGCALRSAHPNAEEVSSLCCARTPLWAACCFRRIRMPKTFVALQCARRCGLRIAFVASECGRISSLCAISLLCGAHAAVGCALLCRIRMPENVVALHRARRCGLRVALLHPYVYRECYPGRRFI